jgi:protein SDA1
LIFNQLMLASYLKPHQTDVTQILAICAQASHDMIPPDALETLLRSIIDNFVTDACSSEIIAAGLNSLREICARCPLAMEEELLAYCITFKAHRDKGVMMAARSLIALYRDINPEILPARERGKAGAMEVAMGRHRLVYGQECVVEGIDGVELLEEDVGDDEGAWMEDGDGGDQEGSGDEAGWVQVSSDEEVPVLSDGERTTREEKKMRRKDRNRLHLGLKLTELPKDETDGLPTAANDGPVKENGPDNFEILGQEESDEEMEYGDEGMPEEEIDGEWDDVEEVVSEEEWEETVEDAPTPSTSTTRSHRIETTRFLTPADFARLKQARQAREAERLANGPRRERARSASPDMNNIVSTSAIEGPRKKQKMNKQERLATVMEGRKDRPKFGSRKGKERGSTTNKVRDSTLSM